MGHRATGNKGGSIQELSVPHIVEGLGLVASDMKHSEEHIQTNTYT